MFTPVVLAGGSGSRLWPLSRQTRPKQFLSLIGEGSMLQQTLERLDNFQHNTPLLICSEEHRFLVAEQLRQQGISNAGILLEPEGRNTAPAIALAALMAVKDDSDAVMLVLPADHLICNEKQFQKSVHSALALAKKGQLVTFGVLPTHAETGYGYIKRGKALGMHGFQVENFVEKPDRSTAEEYLSTGEYYWNSGIFMFSAKRYLEELERFQPTIVRLCRDALEKSSQDLDFLRLDPKAFLSCPAESIDYAVLERTEYAAVIPLDAGWSDIGSWSALWEVSERDEFDNACKGDIVLHDCHGLLVHSDHRLVAAVGVDDLVVVETSDAVLIVHKNRVQEVKKIIEQLSNEKRNEHIKHREIYRPWGMYDSIDQGSRYQVKRITVNPGAKLSLQMHYHRAEHWVVVSGTAKVTIGDTTRLFSENESTFIPVGQVHSLENPGRIPLELIEVQSGAYLGEDDIVRFDDQYGRC